MMGLKTVLCRWPALLALAVVSLAAPALAGDEPEAAAQEEQNAAQATATAAPVAAAGLVAYIDPATGGLTTTPTEEQRAAMRAALAEMVDFSLEDVVEVVLPDGTVMAHLPGGIRHALVVLVAADGSRQFECVSNVPDSNAPASVPAPSAPPTAVAVE